MAAQVELLRVKVEEKSRESFDKAIKDKKKKKKRECSPSDDKRERSEKEVKKIKLHHHQHNLQHAQQRVHPPHQQQNSQARNLVGKEQAPVQHRLNHNHATKKELPPGWAPRKVTPAAHVPQKTSVAAVLPPSPLFTFTPLKVAKAKDPNNKPKRVEKDAKLKPKKENAEANVKAGECKKKKGTFDAVCTFDSFLIWPCSSWSLQRKVSLASAANPWPSTRAWTPPVTRAPF